MKAADGMVTKKCFAALIASSLLGGACYGGQPTGVTSQVIIGSGPPPGFGGNVSLDRMSAAINASGDLVFGGLLRGAGITGDNDDSLWVYQDATGPQMLARAGSPASGFDFFTTYETLGSVSIDDTGRVFFFASVQGPGIEQPNDTAYWSGTPTQLDRVLIPSDTILGTDPAVPYGHLSRIDAYGASGDLAFEHSFETNDPDDPFASGIILGQPDDLSLYIADNGQGSANNLQFRFVDTPIVNRHGQIAFHSGVPGGILGIYSTATGVPSEVVRFTQQAPGFAEGVTFEALALKELRHGGSVGFIARVEGPGIHANNDFSYWVAPPGQTPELMIREWDFLPSRDGETRLRTLETATFNDNGVVVFKGDLNIGDTRANAGVWYGTPGDYELVLQEGYTDAALGGLEVNRISGMQLNNRDLLVFEAGLREIGQADGGDTSLWAYRDGVVAAIVLPGDMVDVATPGQTPDLRVVDGVSALGNTLEDGRGHSLNDRDQLAAVLTFTDNTQALIRYDLTGFFVAGDPGDLTGDGFVGVEDLDVLLANWGSTTFAGSWRDGDADGDGVVGQGDLDVIIANWSTGTPPGGNVPEPASGLAFLALIGLVARRRHH
ncbi:PEP-CTERM sorting domain-containing protein [Phycisphaeraceae bacterium D3-23]